MLGCWGWGRESRDREPSGSQLWLRLANSSGLLWEGQAWSAQQKYQRKMAVVASKAKNRPKKKANSWREWHLIMLVKGRQVPCFLITVRNHSPAGLRTQHLISVWFASETWLSAGWWRAQQVVCCYRPPTRACGEAQLMPKGSLFLPSCFWVQRHHILSVLHHAFGMNVNQTPSLRE